MVRGFFLVKPRETREKDLVTVMGLCLPTVSAKTRRHNISFQAWNYFVPSLTK